MIGIIISIGFLGIAIGILALIRNEKVYRVRGRLIDYIHYKCMEGLSKKHSLKFMNLYKIFEEGYSYNKLVTDPRISLKKYEQEIKQKVDEEFRKIMSKKKE